MSSQQSNFDRNSPQHPGELHPTTPKSEDASLPSRPLGWLDIGYLQSGEIVGFSSLESRDRFNLHGALIDRIKECLAMISSNGRREISHTHHWERNIGFDNCIERLPNDKVTYAQLKPSGNWIPLVHDVEAAPTNALYILLKKRGDERYILLVGAMGLPTEPSPLDKRLKEGSEAQKRAGNFWNEHGLAAKWMYHNDLIIRESETEVCPWEQFQLNSQDQSDKQ